MAKTNGNYFIKYTSNASLEAYRNIYKDSTQAVGLSGIGLTTKDKDFAIQISVRDKNYLFNTIKLVQPKNQFLFDLAITSKEIIMETAFPKNIVHKIKSGESLSGIADKYNVSINEIKNANKLRSNAIIAGKTLKIPTNETESKK
ncbi:MAG: LysM peptidoglycan-binding domain-containing protein [Flavobacterium sp.]|nr:LysM peptidoglycan-binding domain-containing protein [Flavobacterium sp.]